MRLFVIVLGVISSSVAWSHGMHATESGIVSGLLHPMNGIDHVFAAAGMGLWLSLQRFTRLSLPLYITALASGFALAICVDAVFSPDIEWVEWILAATLIITGLLLCKSPRLPQSLAASVITTIFSCHFYAHLNEMPAGLTLPGYAAGFSISTVLLVAVATLVGSAIVRRSSVAWIRCTGAAIATAGVAAFGLA